MDTIIKYICQKVLIMFIETYRINKNKKRLKGRVIDLSKFIRIATTGSSLALQYKNGRIIELFDDFIYTDSCWYGFVNKDGEPIDYMAFCIGYEFVEDDIYSKILAYAKEKDILCFHYDRNEKVWYDN